MRVSTWIPGILGILGPIVIPIAHMVVLWFYWQNYARFVDRRFCSCSCWDTVFKGGYFLNRMHNIICRYYVHINKFRLIWLDLIWCLDVTTFKYLFAQYVDRHALNFTLELLTPVGTYESGIASYKHLYFNATENTMKIWILTVIAIICLYECAKHLISLMITKSVRYSMIFLFCLSIFSHYYAWWAYVNYYNDDFYSQWNHQMFFTVNNFWMWAWV